MRHVKKYYEDSIPRPFAKPAPKPKPEIRIDYNLVEDYLLQIKDKLHIDMNIFSKDGIKIVIVLEENKDKKIDSLKNISQNLNFVTKELEIFERLMRKEYKEVKSIEYDIDSIIHDSYYTVLNVYIDFTKNIEFVKE